MIDFNAVITAAITTSITNAVETATAPLKAQIEKLEERLSATQAILPVKFAAIAETASRLETNMAAMNSRIVNPEPLATALNDQEWFWNKINDYVDRDINNYDFYDAICSTLNRITLENYLNPDKLQEQISDAVSESSAVRKAVKDVAEHYLNEQFDMEDAVKEAVKDLTFEVSVS